MNTKVAETPETTDGFLGDLISTMLVPSYALDGINGTIFNETDYTQAQKDGYFGDDCTEYHKDCPVSLFQVIYVAIVQIVCKYLLYQKIDIIDHI